MHTHEVECERCGLVTIYKAKIILKKSMEVKFQLIETQTSNCESELYDIRFLAIKVLGEIKNNLYTTIKSNLRVNYSKYANLTHWVIRSESIIDRGTKTL